MTLIHSTYVRYYYLDYLEFLDDPLGSNLLDDHLMISLPRTLAVRQEQLTKKQHLIICTDGNVSQIGSAACQTLPFCNLPGSRNDSVQCRGIWQISWKSKFRGITGTCRDSFLFGKITLRNLAQFISLSIAESSQEHNLREISPILLNTILRNFFAKTLISMN